ncbi:hypothetical protein J6590_062282 [Homalodisca vitripennis]|nr:hypothetical protein J6590_062282 [Homalodisca vitripennis]
MVVIWKYPFASSPFGSSLNLKTLYLCQLSEFGSSLRESESPLLLSDTCLWEHPDSENSQPL